MAEVNSSTGQVQRRELSVAQFAGLLEHRLHWPDLTERQLVEGCEFAARSGLAAVLCRPEHVAPAVSAVAGSTTRVVTGLGYHDPNAPALPVEDLKEQASKLVDLGAHEVSLLATPGVMPQATPELLVDQLAAVREVVNKAGATVRVALNSEGLSECEAVSLCGRLAREGAATVQAGALRSGDRPPFNWVSAMREALPRPVRLKWSYPAKSIEVVLVCVALGVDLFDGEPNELLKAARQSSRVGPMTVPKPGVDF